MTQNWFASSIAEERRLCRAGRLVTELSRFDRGWARTRIRGASVEIDAGDSPSVHGMPPAVGALLDAAPPEAPAIELDLDAHSGWRFHAIARDRVTVHRSSDPDVSRSALIVTTAPAHDHSHVAIVSTPRSHAADTRHLEALLGAPPTKETRLDALPLAWSGGSAALLLHEALGHPSERGAATVKWPRWLEVTDAPDLDGIGHLSADDFGRPVTRRDLTRGERPSALRRWSFRDTPIVRMSNLRVTGKGRPAAPPSPRIEIHLVEHGYWDPLTDDVTIRVSLAHLVDGADRALLPRFTFRSCRGELAARMEGWFGPETRYPGVVCSDEGQSLPVGSAAVGLVTRGR